MPKPLVDLLNKHEPNQKVMLFTLPLRAIRVVAIDDQFKTFRVEQLVTTNNDPHNPRGTWNLLSTHGNPVAGRAWGVAVEAAIKAQETLRTKLAARERATRPQLLVPA